MARPRSRKRTNKPQRMEDDGDRPEAGSGLLAIAFNLDHNLQVDDEDDDAELTAAADVDPEEVLAKPATGFSAGREEAAVSPPSPVAATATPPAAPPATPPAAPDLAGSLVADMQHRFAELQKWAQAGTAELEERRRKMDEAEADLDRRREALAAEEQKTAHDRERFARYRSAEIDKLAALADRAEADAADTLAQAETDARILQETAAAEAAEAAEAQLQRGREEIEAERSTAEERTRRHRADVEAELTRRREAVQSERLGLDREKQRVAEASAELATAREELDAEWQSVLRLQRSTEALAKAWEAELERRNGTAGLRLSGGDADEDAPQVRLAA